MCRMTYFIRVKLLFTVRYLLGVYMVLMVSTRYLDCTNVVPTGYFHGLYIGIYIILTLFLSTCVVLAEFL